MKNLKFKLTILIVDDTPDQQIAMVHSLAPYLSNDAIIDKACNGIIAIQLVKERFIQQASPYDLIIMDFCMPHLNGQETTHAIRHLEEQYTLNFCVVPSIIITWSTSKKTPYLGANGILSKPIQQEEILPCIQHWFTKKLSL